MFKKERVVQLEIREKRKLDHIKETLNSYDVYKDYFKDISLIPMSASISDLSNIDLKLNLFGKTLDAPILINAMTGGALGLEKYNQAFARAAKENNIAMAVGSQKAGILNKKRINTYSIVRKINPKGLIFANLSALENIEDMKKAVDMIEADALQLHVNHGQELSMLEGDKNFSSLLKNIEKAIKEIEVPIIVKEVGTGISQESAKIFSGMGVKNFDAGGFGGTNFSLIEEKRKRKTPELLSNIGIPTPVSILEIKKVLPKSLVFASGGIRNSNQIVKSLVIGGDISGIAAYFLKVFMDSDEEKLSKEISSIIEEIKKIFVVLGFQNLEDAKKGKYILKNEIKEWVDQRI